MGGSDMCGTIRWLHPANNGQSVAGKNRLHFSKADFQINGYKKITPTQLIERL